MKKRVFAVWICLLAVMTLLCGCVNDRESAQMEQQCRTLLDALIADDVDAGWAVMSPQYCSRESLQMYFDEYASYFAEVGAYELKQNGFETSINNGIRTVSLSYAVIDGEDLVCYVSVSRVGDSDKLASFTFTPIEGNVSTKTVSIIVLIVIALLGAFGLFAVAAVVIIVVVLLRKRKEEARRAEEAFRLQQQADALDKTNKDV